MHNFFLKLAETDLVRHMWALLLIQFCLRFLIQLFLLYFPFYLLYDLFRLADSGKYLFSTLLYQCILVMRLFCRCFKVKEDVCTNGSTSRKQLCLLNETKF